MDHQLIFGLWQPEMYCCCHAFLGTNSDLSKKDRSLSHLNQNDGIMDPLEGFMTSTFLFHTSRIIQTHPAFSHTPAFQCLQYNFISIGLRTHIYTLNICMQLFCLISSHSYTLSVTVRWSTEEVATQQIALIMNS